MDMAYINQNAIAHAPPVTTITTGYAQHAKPTAKPAMPQNALHASRPTNLTPTTTVPVAFLAFSTPLPLQPAHNALTRACNAPPQPQLAPVARNPCFYFTPTVTTNAPQDSTLHQTRTYA
jgi:hypothetical protein